MHVRAYVCVCVCVYRRRIPILEVGSAARHVNACLPPYHKGGGGGGEGGKGGILQLLPGSAVAQAGVRGPPGGTGAKRAASHKWMWFKVMERSSEIPDRRISLAAVCARASNEMGGTNWGW